MAHLEVLPKIVDSDVALLVVVKRLEAFDIHVNLVLGEVNGDILGTGS